MQFIDMVRYAIDTFGFAIVPITWPEYDVPIEELKGTEFEYTYVYFDRSDGEILRWIEWPFGDSALLYRAGQKPKPAYAIPGGLEWYETRGHIPWCPRPEYEEATFFLGHDRTKYYLISMIEDQK